MNVSLRLLRAFLAVSREGNVGRAAAAMYVSQPSLSQDIRRLEREVGVTLFVRTPQGVMLTAAGEALRQDVQTALTLFERGVERARAAAAALRLRVTLAFTPSIGHRLVPSLLPWLERANTDVVVDEREVDTGEIVPGVTAGLFDLGLAHCPDRGDELRITDLVEERLCVALSAEHPLAGRDGIRLAELEGLDLLVWPREVAPSYYDHLLGVCAAGGLTPAVRPGPRRAFIRSYVLSDGGTFCLLPEATSQLQLPGVAFVDVTDAGAAVPLSVVCRQGEDRPEVLSTQSAIIAGAGALSET